MTTPANRNNSPRTCAMQMKQRLLLLPVWSVQLRIMQERMAAMTKALIDKAELTPSRTSCSSQKIMAMASKTIIAMRTFLVHPSAVGSRPKRLRGGSRILLDRALAKVGTPATPARTAVLGADFTFRDDSDNPWCRNGTVWAMAIGCTVRVEGNAALLGQCFLTDLAWYSKSARSTSSLSPGAS